jgi:hypothetical protein
LNFHTFQKKRPVLIRERPPPLNFLFSLFHFFFFFSKKKKKKNLSSFGSATRAVGFVFLLFLAV